MAPVPVGAIRGGISVIVPALNEEGNLRATVEQLLPVLRECFDHYEVIIFNDGSQDRTGAIAEELAGEDPHIQVIQNPHTMGLGYNYRQGVSLATQEYLVMFPGDNQFPQDSVKRLLGLVGRADIIVPYTSNSWVRPWGRRLVSWAFVLLLNTLFGLRLHYYTGTVVHRTTLVKSVPITASGFAYQAEILIRLIKSGFSFLEVGIEIQERPFGHSKVFTPRNLVSVVKTVAHIFWEIRLRGRRRYNQPLRRVVAGGVRSYGRGTELRS